MVLARLFVDISMSVYLYLRKLLKSVGVTRHPNVILSQKLLLGIGMGTSLIAIQVILCPHVGVG